MHRTQHAPMRVLLTVILLLTSLAAIAAAPAERGRSAEALAAKADREGALRLVVQVDTTRSGPAVASEARSHGATQIRTFDMLPYVAMKANGQAIRALDRRPDVVAIQEDVPEAPQLASTLPVIDADDVHALGWTGAGTTIAILDTGIDADHPFFRDNDTGGGSRIVSQACYSTPADGDEFTLCNDGTTSSTAANAADIDGHAGCATIANNCDHGTHVAGIAAGDATSVTGAPGDGVAPDASIIAIQVFTRFTTSGDCNPRPAPCILTYPSDQVAGLNRVAQLNSDNPGWNIVAANMSLGGGANASACDSDTRKPAIDALLAAGIATVVAAGNNSNLNGVSAPACVSTAVTVGNSADNDTVWPSSDRGPLLDIFAPGGNVDSSIVDDTWGSKNGTSMAAPHVAGAYAVLTQAYPSRGVGALTTDMTSTGVPITYATNTAGTTTQTTPRLDLLAALQNPNEPPTVAADAASVTVDEGEIATNSGTVSDPEDDDIIEMTASVGTVQRTGGTWSWSFQTSDGPAQSQTVTISATDDKGETSSTTFALTVDNVAPTVTVTPITAIDEGGVVTVTATYSDPGYLDTHVATIDWGVPAGQEGELVSGPTLTQTVSGGPGTPRQGTVTASYRYGDNDAGSGFTVTVTVTDKDGGQGSDSKVADVANVAPSAAIDLGSTVLLDGTPTIVAHAGEDVSFGGSATDPGSDDLAMTWDYGDSSTDTSTSLVNPPAADPLPSPTVQPRNGTDGATHAFADACLYTVDWITTDDDGGSTTDSVAVVITGNADLARSSGYWSAEYRGKKSSDFTPATLQCYLDIVRHVSAVFDEERTLTTIQDAANVLKTNGSASASDLLDAQLLAAWLNFANGAYDLDELVDSDGDGIADITFLDLLTEAEALRLDPNASRADLIAMKTTLERLNNP